MFGFIVAIVFEKDNVRLVAGEVRQVEQFWYRLRGRDAWCFRERDS